MTLDQKKYAQRFLSSAASTKKVKLAEKIQRALRLSQSAICNLQGVLFYYNYNLYNDEVLSSGHGKQFLRSAFYEADNP